MGAWGRVKPRTCSDPQAWVPITVLNTSYTRGGGRVNKNPSSSWGRRVQWEDERVPPAPLQLPHSVQETDPTTLNLRGLQVPACDTPEAQEQRNPSFKGRLSGCSLGREGPVKATRTPRLALAQVTGNRLQKT